MALQLADRSPIVMAAFARLATVELQLVMRCCDRRTLLALARCNRAAFAAANHPFAWRALSPLQLVCSVPLELSAQLSSSLLRHAHLSVEWTISASADAVEAQRRSSAHEAEAEDTAMVAETAALVSLPGLRHLAVFPSIKSPDFHVTKLATALRQQIEHGGALASLTLEIGAVPSSEALFIALATFLEHTRTLTALKVNCYDMNEAMVRTLAVGLQQNQSLAALDLSDCAIYNEGASMLAAALVHSRTLTDLQLGNCCIGDAGAQAMATALEPIGGMRVLDFSYNNVGAAGMVALAPLLASDCCAIEHLDLCGCAVGNDGAAALAKSLQTNRTLTTLRLGGCRIGVEGTMALAAALQRNNQSVLREIDLTLNQIDAAGAASLAEFMRVNSALERLDLSRCCMDDASVVALAAGLPHAHSLRELRLQSNRFGAVGAADLAAGIRLCPTLVRLELSDNSALGDAGFSALAPALHGLQSLDMRRCGLTSATGPSLATLVRHATRLGTLDLNWNVIGSAGVTAIADALQSSSSLRALYLFDCHVGAEGAAALANALAREWPATTLHLFKNTKIGDEGARALAAALDQCGSRCILTELSLAECGLSMTGVLAVVRAAVRIPTLRTLTLHGIVDVTDADKAALVAECEPEPHFRLIL